MLKSGELYTFSGAVVTDATIYASGAVYASGGTLDNTTIMSGSYVYALGGQFSQADIQSGARLTTYTADGAVDTRFENGGQLVLEYASYVSGATATLDAATDVLTVVDGSRSIALSLPGDYTGAYFTVSSYDGVVEITAGGIACFCEGTGIATADGEVAVERLAIGDIVRTASGALRPIRWIGRRSYDGRFASRNPDVLPVLFRAGSLGDGIPARDLIVSPSHAMFLDGVLIPAEALVNGTSIVKLSSIGTVSYVHVELDSHDVLLAEGAPSESFVDDDSRSIFRNAAEYAVLYPDRSAATACFCAPRLEDGETVEIVRQRLAARSRMMSRETGWAAAG